MVTVKEEIKKHIPCSVCGNSDVSNFTLRGTIKNKQKSLIVVCDECSKVYNVGKSD